MWFEAGQLQSAGGDEFAPDVVPREVSRALMADARWNRKDGWLAEGLPEYLAWRYLLKANPEAARVVVATAMRDAGTEVHLLTLADIQNWWAHGEDVLAKENRELEKRQAQKHGLLLLRTLETVIDRERVDRVLPRLIQRGGEGPPTTALLEKACEEIAGRNLKWFFDYYVEGKELPTIDLRRLLSESPGVVAGEIVVKGLPPEGSVRVEMAIRTAQGIVEHSVATRGGVTPFSANVSAPVIGITLDPDLRILRWTEAAERSKAQTAILAALPNELTPDDLPTAIEVYRRAVAADPEDASSRAQLLHERLGELESAHEEWAAARADLEAAINGHSLSPFDTYLCRAEAYLHHGELQLHENRPKEALEDAQAGLALPRVVLQAYVPAGLPGSSAMRTLQQALESLRDSASRQ